ncbi:MAG: SDR family NAD(P)-dependent oxidoreductase [Phenylobacterium sp.]|uniref:SDR family NAD(P)-dependent oxidoreductase n=1 Tax=Phenylobacterium sp. TaxID=1871053 RepID=UPI0027230DA9|nr:SDR family NAD(P)-dependent oxidoreductase [Phenylobacterium sp.]MDO8911058.1 SDR family NAD(P)-dependent oxidoreductase [Phenylobacterium sp.]MDP3099679.1 SDR family NAD(P)-dependent oxidoreductase [Phenylobacterium sp.]
MKSVVVTGVSTGIGWGITKVLTGQGVRVFGSVRKAADADRLRQEFGDRFVPLIFDVTDEAAVRAAAEQVRVALAGETLMGLVNNAGVAVAGPLLHLPIADFRQQIEVNLTGVVIATQAFAPLLNAGGKGASGRIVNISSVGGKNGSPFLAPYNASKFAVEGLSEALRRELMLFGVDVIVVAPGAVATPIWGKARPEDIEPYRHTPFYPALQKVHAFMTSSGAAGLRPEAIGEAVAKALTTPKPKVRYTVAPNPLTTFMMANLPRRVVDNMVGKRLGLSS